MPISFRGGFYSGLLVALLVGLLLIWLWQPERQVRRHTENFLHAIEHKNWTGAAGFIGSDYRDQWRARVLDRMHEGFRYVRGIRISAFSVTVRVEPRRAEWTGRIWINGDGGEIAESLKERVNSLATPFQLEWHRLSGKPWDWKLVRVSNSSLEIPANLD
ncbi:MAG: hypothetical protein DME66_04880 [Verrucomicrobia bacterium]|nr:MAG: hypothetical protein DME66_04880 [Verrucomicrobiota bacterium]